MIKKLCVFVLALAVFCLSVPTSFALAEGEIISKETHQLYTDENILRLRSELGIDERSAPVKALTKMQATCEIRPARARAATAFSGQELQIEDISYTTQLVERTVYADGVIEEQYAATAIAKVARDFTGTSTSEPTISGSTAVYARVTYRARYQDGIPVLLEFTQTGSGHRVTYVSGGPTAQVLAMVGRLRNGSGLVEDEISGSQYSPSSGVWYSLGAPSSGQYLTQPNCVLNAESAAYMSNGQEVVVNYVVDASSLP